MININDYKNIVVLTGAGISAPCGIPTYRDSDGNVHPDYEYASEARNLPESLSALWKMYGNLRIATQNLEPSKSHKALAQFSHKPDVKFTLITQNVDGMHRKAGTHLDSYYEIHGTAHQSKCISDECHYLSPFDDDKERNELYIHDCGHQLRPNIVLFGEFFDDTIFGKAFFSLLECDLYVAIGTSGNVFPAAGFVTHVRKQKNFKKAVVIAKEWPVNASEFDEHYIGNCEDIVPNLFKI